MTAPTERTAEFSPPASHWLARAYYTPLVDALHGNLSGRLDVRREIAAAGLPQPIAALVYTVARRARLWRGEKLDVARELSAHFADGLAADRSAEQLIADFGSAEQAAKLIRHAKRRGRPLYWQAWWYASRALMVLASVALVCCGALAARFYLSRPNVARNYWQEINAARRLPEDERAWPLYRNAFFKLDRNDSVVIGNYMEVAPDSKHWPELVAATLRRQDVIKLLRAAAQKPHLGALLGDPADAAAAKAAGDKRLVPADAPLADANQELISAPLTHLQVLRELARLLTADARRAAVAGDGEAVFADLTALLGMSAQIFEPHATIVEQLVGIAIFDITANTLQSILADTPAVLNDAQLRDLAHRLAAWRDGNIRAYFSGERDMFYDILQRIYTDDGQGNGRLTPRGIDALHDLVSDAPPALNPDQRLARLLGPGLAALVGTREESRELYESILDEMIAAHQGPPWEWDYDTTHAVDQRLTALRDSVGGTLRFFLPIIMLPALGNVFSVDQRAVQIRDAAEVAIALELWHRRHDAWPTSLDQLLPDLLPSVPSDRYDGQPLRYTLRDGKPILYSVGVDRNDDGGRPSDPPQDAMIGSYGPSKPRNKQATPQVSDWHDGDWVLFPPIREREPEDADNQ
ncbi:MAG TPA: hypothetical protein VFW87_13370 [Pirellulales bacterium]|nr:hypothetical protein [Pirellulales bacterium]